MSNYISINLGKLWKPSSFAFCSVNLILRLAYSKWLEVAIFMGHAVTWHFVFLIITKSIIYFSKKASYLSCAIFFSFQTIIFRNAQFLPVLFVWYSQPSIFFLFRWSISWEMSIILHRDNDKGVLEDQILGSPVRNQFQKDADSQSVIYSLPFDNQDQQIILYWFIFF